MCFLEFDVKLNSNIPELNVYARINLNSKVYESQNLTSQIYMYYDPLNRKPIFQKGIINIKIKLISQSSYILIITVIIGQIWLNFFLNIQINQSLWIIVIQLSVSIQAQTLLANIRSFIHDNAACLTLPITIGILEKQIKSRVF
ncbi:hypothetical protein pb186bvf_005525 [Paramecium bursaria]